ADSAEPLASAGAPPPALALPPILTLPPAFLPLGLGSADAGSGAAASAGSEAGSEAGAGSGSDTGAATAGLGTPSTAAMIQGCVVRIMGGRSGLAGTRRRDGDDPLLDGVAGCPLQLEGRLVGDRPAIGIVVGERGIVDGEAARA